MTTHSRPEQSTTTRFLYSQPWIPLAFVHASGLVDQAPEDEQERLVAAKVAGMIKRACRVDAWHLREKRAPACSAAEKREPDSVSQLAKIQRDLFPPMRNGDMLVSTAFPGITARLVLVLGDTAFVRIEGKLSRVRLAAWRRV